MTADNNIGEKIRYIRKKVDLSQDRFGKKIGVSGKSISAYETGRATPSLRVLDAISETYNETIIHTNSSRKEYLLSYIKGIREYLVELEKKLSL